MKRFVNHTCTEPPGLGTAPYVGFLDLLALISRYDTYQEGPQSYLH